MGFSQLIRRQQLPNIGCAVKKYFAFLVMFGQIHANEVTKRVLIKITCTAFRFGRRCIDKEKFIQHYLIHVS
jgi:hypothetical protein